MNENTEKLIEKLRKLRAHAESAEKIGNEAEAQAFAAMFQQLLLKHKLSMTDVEVAEQEVEEPVGEFYVNFNGQVKSKSTRSTWQIDLGSIVAKAYFCRILCISRTNRLILVGRKSDTEIAEYVLVTLIAAAERLSKHAKHEYITKTYGRARGSYPELKGFRTSWLTGFVVRLGERLRDELNRTVSDTANSSTALVRVNRATLAVNTYMERFKSKFRATRQQNVNWDGLRAGRAAADKMDIVGRAMNSGRSVEDQPLLT